MIWEVSGNFKRAWFVADLWMIKDELEQSSVRRQSTEPFYPVFNDGCLWLPSLYFRDDLVYGFVPSSNCQK